MADYKVRHRYKSGPFAFEKGSVVTLSEAEAEWVNRDSEGTLELVPEPEPEASAEEPEPPKKATRKRAGG